MYILIDNYDSFTYNIYQYLREITDLDVRVFRNDSVTLEELEELHPKGLIISPGPGRPEDAGISLPAIKHFAGVVPILGVCLGHQAIGQAYGGKIVGAGRIVHGKAEEIRLDGKGLFRTIPSPAVFTRYHSLVIEEASLPEDLEITARSVDGEIMGVRHRELCIEGIQFHPESIASEFGKKILQNFLNYKREPFKTRQVLTSVLDGKDMTMKDAEGFMNTLTDGDLSSPQIAGFLAALNAKGITPEEITGCVRVLRNKKVPFAPDMAVLDTCGTGGDGLGTFNISSLAALVAASCGVPVAKHGNRAVSSNSGSADFYKTLGIPLNHTPRQSMDLLKKTGFTFLFAPLYHSAMKYAAEARRELGIKTIFNLLGPLANPAEAEFQVIGVFDEKFCIPVARAAHMLGVKRALVVHGMDGQDELSVTGPSRIVFIGEDGEVQDSVCNPEDFGLSRHSLDQLIGGNAERNAEIAMNILRGEGHEAIRDAVILNTGAALRVFGTVGTIQEGCAVAEEALSSGKALAKLEEIRQAGAA